MYNILGFHHSEDLFYGLLGCGHILEEHWYPSTKLLSGLSHCEEYWHGLCIEVQAEIYKMKSRME